MNARYKTQTAITSLSAALLIMISCNNPVDTRAIATEVEPETGINTNSETGLIAGFPLDGDILLENTGVSVSEDDTDTPTIEWTQGLSGFALKSDENGDYIRIADGVLPEITISGTVEVWVKPEQDTVNYYSGILHKGDNPEVTPEWYFVDEAWTMMFHSDSKPFFFVVCEDENGSFTPISLKAAHAITKNEWSHLAATWSYNETSKDTVIKLYVNGVEVLSKTRNGIGPVRDSDGDLIIGSQLPVPYGTTYYTFKGLIDEVSLYNVERTPEEIQTDYQVFASEL